MNKEIWKPVKGYKHYYEVSNQGRVRSLTRKLLQYNPMNRKIENHLYRGKILSPSEASNYARVVLCKNTIKRHYSIHRLVALAFLSNPKNYSIVHHLNSNSLDNRVENLEWATQQHNMNMTSEQNHNEKGK